MNLDNKIWEYNGDKFKVGDSLYENFNEKNNIFPIVWFKGRVYNSIIKPESPPRKDRICLIDIYNSEKKVYWTTVDKVFHIIKL